MQQITQQRNRAPNLSEYHPFKSAEAKAEYLKFYDALASQWPIPSETRVIETTDGQTLVRISGPAGAPALVLLPGASFNSLMWLPQIEALSRTYRTYAVDNLFDNGRSVRARDFAGFEDYVGWLDELFLALGLEQDINLLGLSFGGQLTAEYALRHPERLGKIVLLAPGAVAQPVSSSFNLHVMLCLLPHRYFMENFYSWLFRDLIQKDEAGRKLAAMQVEESLLGIKCFKPRRIISPRVFSDAELERLKVPALYLVGENEKLYDPRKAVGRLSQVAPQIKAEIIPGAGHDLVFSRQELVIGKVLDFLK